MYAKQKPLLDYSPVVFINLLILVVTKRYTN